jgi:hypothetical protein
MLQQFKGLDLTTLSLETLEGIEGAVASFLFKQQAQGEKFHPSYRSNRKSFKRLMRETVKFKREMGKFFAAQYQRITPRIYAPLIRADDTTDYETDYLYNIDWNKEDQTLTATLEINLGSLFEVGAKATELQLQADLNIGPHMTEEARFLREYTVKLSGEINQTTRKRITQQIKTSIEVGETKQQLTDRISDVLNNPKRARMIAQTESIRAYAEGRLAVGRRLKIPYKQLQSFQVDAGEICGQVNGQVVRLEENFSNGLSSPPFHPNCLLGDTVVAAEGVSKQYKRWFDGEVVTISIAGQNITATPNHPILTERGWVAAGKLQVSDRLYKRLDWNNLVINPDNDYVVARIEEIGRSINVPNGVFPVTMPLTPEDFHGDVTVNTEVEIIDTDGLLPNNRTKRKKLLIYKLFRNTHLFGKLFKMNRSINRLAGWLSLNTQCLISSLSTSLTSFGSSTLGLNPISFAYASHGQVKNLESLPETASSNSDTLSNIVGRFTGKIALVEIENVSRRKFSGHVYNLTSVRDKGLRFSTTLEVLKPKRSQKGAPP